MGRISRRLVKKLRRHESVVDETLHASLLRFAATLSDSAPVARALLEDGYGQLYVQYMLARDFVRRFADGTSAFKDFSEYFDIVVDAEYHFPVDTDETTPVTGNCFGLWTLFDLRFGADRETMGSCVIDVLESIQADPQVLRLITALSESRMGIYQHQGLDGRCIRLRELVTGQTRRCYCESGHRGEPGELWFVRLGPSLDRRYECDVTLTTPYVLTQATVDDWTAYLNKSLLGCRADEPQNVCELLKYGKSRTAWLDFIVRAYLRADGQAVYLAGLPDVPSSLPNAEYIETLQAAELRPGTALVQERVLLELTAPQRNALLSLLPDLSDVPCGKSHRPMQVRLSRLQLHRAESRAPQVLCTLKSAQRKPYERLLEWIASDRSVVTGRAVYQLRIELDGAHPKIWRTIQTYDCTLDDLHTLIQAAMGWQNEHLYEFEAGGVRYSVMPEEIYGDRLEPGDADMTHISQVVPIGDRRAAFVYRYDFGDEWCHTVSVERIVPAEKTTPYPVCLAGQGACPPEDCGGTFWYNELVHSYADPNSDGYGEAVEWLGESADLRAFDVQATTRAMRNCLG